MDAKASEQFTRQLGMVFQPQGADVALALVKLVPQQIGFILLFQGPAKPVLPEGLYDFAVEDGSSCAFHIMPIHTPVPGHQDYQAVFN